MTPIDELQRAEPDPAWSEGERFGFDIGQLDWLAEAEFEWLAKYNAFLEAKTCTAKQFGITSDFTVNAILHRHQPDIVKWAVRGGRRAIFASFGLGKCHGAGTKILMADGSIRSVEDVLAGDSIMGDDGTPRKVLSLASGRDQIYRITLKNGDAYECNSSHILSLVVSNKADGLRMGDVVDMPLLDYLKLPLYKQRNCYKHYKVPVEFMKQEIPFDPYLYGAWLGDGSCGSLAWTINDLDEAIVDRIRIYASSLGIGVRESAGRGCKTYFVTNGPTGKSEAPHYKDLQFLQSSSDEHGKRVDRRYLTNERSVQLQVLAGLIDTDGFLIDKCYEIATKWEGLRDDILFLCRSVGLAVSHRIKIVNGVTYQRIFISGNTDMIPCITRKRASSRKQIKTPLVYGFKVETVGEGDYYGFVIDGNHRYLLGDFTVTHNTMIQLEIGRIIAEACASRFLIVIPLGVIGEFLHDAGMLGIPVRFVRSLDECSETGVYLTNYETVRDGKLDPRNFCGASLDEASVLRGLGGSKTFREFMRLFEGMKYKFVATATPSPNEYIELLAYSQFLEINEVSEIKTRFFKRDSTSANNLTIHPHKEAEFMAWLATWALYIERPSDLGYADEGYDIPALKVHWHEVSTDHTAATPERNGQGRIFKNSSLGVVSASREKRDSIDVRIEKMLEIIGGLRTSPAIPGVPASAKAEDGMTDQVVLWADLNDEQDSIEKALECAGISCTSLRGTGQSLEFRMEGINRWKRVETSAFLSKLRMYGSGTNMQQCHTMIFVGIGFKFQDIIQGLHRIHRYQQKHPCNVHFIFTEAERNVKKAIERKWKLHKDLSKKMTELIKTHGLAINAIAQALGRAMGVERVEVSGSGWKAVQSDCVLETRRMRTSSVDHILTSIPFGNQYEYSPNYSDLGHTDNPAHFFQQMDFLTPELLRILKPGRVAAIHVKDRITPGGINKLGFQTVYPFHCDVIKHYCEHGFALIAIKTIVTDVVRENNQTYRLGYSEQCKDGSKIGAGMPEYLLVFRKPPSDSSDGYADNPVRKQKPDSVCLNHDFGPAGDMPCRKCGAIVGTCGPVILPFERNLPLALPVQKGRYSRARWQVDAHGFERSDGNRQLTPVDLANMDHGQIFRTFRDYYSKHVYNYESHVKIGEALDAQGILPVTFMLLQPPSWSDEVWSDVTRMLGMNTLQSQAGKEQHVCPMQWDIADRCITQYTMPGELVYDPFGGLGTVPYRALLAGREGCMAELSSGYFWDAISYLKAAEAKVSMPSLFDMLEAEEIPA